MGKPTKKALLFFDRAEEYSLRVESALLEKEFEVLRVSTIEQFLERTRTEIFQVFVVFFHSEAYLRGTLEIARKSFPSKLTPKVLVGPSIQFSSQEHTSVFNQYFLNDTDPEMIAEFCLETADLFYQDNRRIKISDFDVPRILANLSSLRFTGEVDVDHGEEQCSVYFHFGKIVCASSSREDQKFGQLLLQFGIVTPEQVSHVLGLVSSQGKRIGQIFVDLGMITNSKLLEMLELQVKHIVIPTFNWIDGEAEIVFQTANPDEVFPIQIDPARLIKEGIKLRLSDRELESKVPSQNHYVRCLPNKQVVLEDRDAAIYGYLQGMRQRIESILVSNRFSRTELMRALYFFKLLDLVEFVEALQKDDVPIEKKESLDRLYRDEGPQITRAPESPQPQQPFPWKLLAWILVPLSLALGVWLRARVDPAETSSKPLVAKVDPTFAPTQVAPTSRPTELPPSPVPTPAPTQVPPAPKKERPRVPVPPAPLPESSDAKIARAKAARAGGDWVVAEAGCIDVVRKKPDAVDCLLILGEISIEQDRTEEARRSFQKILAIDARHARANLHWGTLLIEDGKPKEAAPYLRAFVENADAKVDAKLIVETQKVLQSMEAGQ